MDDVDQLPSNAQDKADLSMQDIRRNKPNYLESRQALFQRIMARQQQTSARTTLLNNRRPSMIISNANHNGQYPPQNNNNNTMGGGINATDSTDSYGPIISNSPMEAQKASAMGLNTTNTSRSVRQSQEDEFQFVPGAYKSNGPSGPRLAKELPANSSPSTSSTTISNHTHPMTNRPASLVTSTGNEALITTTNVGGTALPPRNISSTFRELSSPDMSPSTNSSQRFFPQLSHSEDSFHMERIYRVTSTVEDGNTDFPSVKSNSHVNSTYNLASPYHSPFTKPSVATQHQPYSNSPNASTNNMRLDPRTRLLQQQQTSASAYINVTEQISPPPQPQPSVAAAALTTAVDTNSHNNNNNNNNVQYSQANYPTQYPLGISTSLSLSYSSSAGSTPTAASGVGGAGRGGSSSNGLTVTAAQVDLTSSNSSVSSTSNPTLISQQPPQQRPTMLQPQRSLSRVRILSKHKSFKLEDPDNQSQVSSTAGTTTTEVNANNNKNHLESSVIYLQQEQQQQQQQQQHYLSEQKSNGAYDTIASTTATTPVPSNDARHHMMVPVRVSATTTANTNTDSMDSQENKNNHHQSTTTATAGNAPPSNTNLLINRYKMMNPGIRNVPMEERVTVTM
jgi:hypothetical protein